MRTPLTYYGGKQALARQIVPLMPPHRDALDLILRWDRSDAVIYVDPPYAGPYRLATGEGYDVDDDGTLWARLVDVLADVKDAAVLLSGYPCEEAERLGWRMVELRARRTVQSRDGETLSFAPEVVWLSPAVPEPTLTLWEAA